MLRFRREIVGLKDVAHCKWCFGMIGYFLLYTMLDLELLHIAITILRASFS